MQATDKFKTIVNDHLQGLAKSDQLFAETLKKPNKNIDDCITYILNTVKSSGKMGFADEEIFDMAVHYYDDDDIKIGPNVNAKVVVNQPLGTENKQATKALSTEKKKSEKQLAKEKLLANQPSLFSQL